MGITRVGCYLAAAAMIAMPVIASGTAWASPSAQPGSTLWAVQHAGLSDAIAASPDGSQVFVAGGDAGKFATVAYDAATGHQQWDALYQDPIASAQATAVAVSPDGRTVFVTGGDSGGFPTVAYDAATGQQLWASRHAGNGNVSALAVSQDGGTVYVIGTGLSRTSGRDYITIAYQAATGQRLWISTYNGRANGGDFADALALSPDGSTVYVTGESRGRTSGFDAATVAYQAATGQQLWVSRYNGHANRSDVAYSIAVSNDGRRVYVTGTSQGARSHEDIFTAAYGTAHGTSLWTRRYNGPANLNDGGAKVLVSPLGGTVIACGTSRARTDNYVAIAYNSVTGATEWTGSYNGTDHANSLSTAAFSPNGVLLYLTGTATQLFDGGGDNTYLFTNAVNAATGAQAWGLLATAQDGVNSYASSIAVSPDGDAVYTGLNAFGIGKFETIAIQA